MKKVLAVLMIALIALSMYGCGANDDPVGAAGGTPTADPLSRTGTQTPDPLGTTDPLAALNGTSTPAPSDDPDDGGAAPADDDLSGLVDDGDDDPLAGDDPITATPTPSPTATPKPSAPATDIAVKDYQYATYTDPNLLFEVEYPSHWEVKTSENSITIQFIEPVEDGKVPMRLALSVMTYEQTKLTNTEKKNLFKKYVNDLKTDFKAFKQGKIDNKIPFINRKAFNVTYLGKREDGGTTKGYVIMTDVESRQQVVALHFSAPQARYKNGKAIVKKALYSVTPVNAPST